MELATLKDTKEIMDLYESVIEAVNRSKVKLGWNTKTYPDEGFVTSAIFNNELFVVKVDGKIVASAVINNKMNKENHL